MYYHLCPFVFRYSSSSFENQCLYYLPFLPYISINVSIIYPSFPIYQSIPLHSHGSFLPCPESLSSLYLTSLLSFFRSFFRSFFLSFLFLTSLLSFFLLFSLSFFLSFLFLTSLLSFFLSFFLFFPSFILSFFLSFFLSIFTFSRKVRPRFLSCVIFSFHL